MHICSTTIHNTEIVEHTTGTCNESCLLCVMCKWTNEDLPFVLQQTKGMLNGMPATTETLIVELLACDMFSLSGKGLS